MQGMLLVDKPTDWTSFDVVNYVRRIVAQVEGKKPKNCKVGHTGTLDPFATGLLVLLIGKEYTRRAGELSKQDKTYEVTMRLGESSTTGDPEGVITERHSEYSSGSVLQPTSDDIKAAFAKFTGPIMQTPPAFSAIKVNGQRAYKLAREGKAVVIEARPVTIHRIELEQYTYPEVTFSTDVSSGTYIRTLVEDIAKSLGTVAYTSALRRTSIAKLSIEQAVSKDDITPETLPKMLINLQ